MDFGYPRWRQHQRQVSRLITTNKIFKLRYCTIAIFELNIEIAFFKMGSLINPPMVKPPTGLRPWLMGLLAAGGLLIIFFWQCLPSPLFNESTSTVLLDRKGQLLGAQVAPDG